MRHRERHRLVIAEESLRSIRTIAGPLGIAYRNGAAPRKGIIPNSNEGKAVLAARGKCAVGISAVNYACAEQQSFQELTIFSCRCRRQELPNFIRPFDVLQFRDRRAVPVDDTDGIVAALLPDGVERKRLVLLINRVQGIVLLAAVDLRPADLGVAEAGKERALQLQRAVVLLVHRRAVARAVCAGGVGHGIGHGLQLELLRGVIADAVARAVRGKAAGVIRAVGLGEHHRNRRVLRSNADLRTAAELIQCNGFSVGKIEICAGVSGDLHVAGKGQGACAQRDRTLAAGVAGNPAGAEVGGRAVFGQRNGSALVVLNFDGNGAALLRHRHLAVDCVDARAGILRDRSAVEVDGGVFCIFIDIRRRPAGGGKSCAGVAGDGAAVEVDGILHIDAGGEHAVPRVAGDDAVIHVEGSLVDHTGTVLGVADVADDRAICGIVGAFLIVAAAVHIERAAVINAANRGAVMVVQAVFIRAGHADAHAVKVESRGFRNINGSAAVTGDEAAVAGHLAVCDHQTRILPQIEGRVLAHYIAGKGMAMQAEHKRAAVGNIELLCDRDIIGKVAVECCHLAVCKIKVYCTEILLRFDHVHF